jgi:membrane protein
MKVKELVGRFKNLSDPEVAREALPGRLGPMVSIALRSRFTGLAAEVAFWGVFILPWVLLGIVGSVGVVSRWFEVDAVTRIRDEIMQRANDVLTSETANETLRPILDEILLEGNGGLGILGFGAALWSGSRLVSTVVVVVRAVHAAAVPESMSPRSWAQVRATSLGAYLLALATLAIAFPLLLLGPQILARLGLGAFTSVLYWGGTTALALFLVAGMYRAAVPKHDLRAAVIGATVALVVWGIGSLALRLYLGGLGEASPVEAFAAPVALLLWAYVTALAVVLGAVVDAGLRRDIRDEATMAEVLGAAEKS